MEAARYPHDCDACVYLGQWRKYDLYYCDKQMGNRPTVIGRYGPDVRDYVSGMVFAAYPDTSPELAEARKRAMDAGLYSGDQYKWMPGWQKVDSGGDI